MGSRVEMQLRRRGDAQSIRGRRRSPGVVTGLAGVAALLSGVLFVLLRDAILPARFSYDAQGIQAIGQGTLHVVDPAFESVAAVYRALGLVNDPTAASLIGFLLAFAVLAVAGRDLLEGDAPPSAAVLFFVSVLLSAVYLGTYSKDVFILPIVLLAVLSTGRTRWLVATGLAILAYAVVFRTYWFVVLGVWVVLQIVLTRRPRLGALLVAMIASGVLLAAAIGLVLGQSADTFRISTNEGRIGSEDAASAIVPFVSGGTILTGIINTPLTLLSLLVPVPLMLKGSVYFLVLAALITLFWLRTGVAAHRSLRSALAVGDRSRIALLLAFVVVQALFEPDYGSALRHLTPLLAVVVLLWSRRRATPPDSVGGPATRATR